MRLAFSFVFLNFACSFCTGSLLNIFKGSKSLNEAILAQDRQRIFDILAWKKCTYLLKDNHAALSLLVTKGPPSILLDLFLEICHKEEVFLTAAVISALKLDDEVVLEELLSVLREISDDYNYLVGFVFKLCASARNYQCVETMVDWHVLLDCGGMNIYHMAAENDDFKLLKYAPKDEYFLDIRDRLMNYPMDRVKTVEMALAISKRWDEETKKRQPIWGEVFSIYNMAKKFGIPDKTLIYRANWAAHELQHSVDQERSPLKLKVNRNSVLKSSYIEATKNKRKWYVESLNVKITFDDEIGLDYGGPRYEWLSLMIEAMFKENPDGNAANFTAPLFEIIDDESGMYAPNNLYPNDVYKFAGSVAAIAFRDKISLKVKMIPAAMKLLLKRHWQYESEDFKAQHPTIYKNLMNLKSFSSEELDSLDLEFESSPNKKVTINNLDEYIEDYGKNLLFFKYKDALNAFATGFHEVIQKSKVLALFNYNEITNVLKGGEESFDLESFKRNSNVSGSEESKKMFWEMMKSLSGPEKMQFYKFVTGRSSIPFEGLKGLPQKFDINLDFLPLDSLPVAATCFAKISFAKCPKSAKEMKEKLIYAMENTKSFNLA